MSEKSVAKVRPSSMAVLVLFWEEEQNEKEGVEENTEQVKEQENIYRGKRRCWRRRDLEQSITSQLLS